MNSGSVQERRSAARDLRGQPRSSKLVPYILQACRDSDADVRMYGFYALGKVDPRDGDVISAILDGVADTVVDVRRALASSLGTLSPFPNTCIPHMVKMLTDPDDKVRKLIFTALSDLQGAGVGSLMRNIDVKDEELRLAVIGVLAQIGPDAKAALPRLKQIAQEDEDLRFREAAGRAVKYIER
jgi:HEAT repeat protein